ncbi:MAG: TolC family protein [Pirellulales bacterium]|nr:TolC family protein [Pirellulales bacterium]
MHKSPLIRTPLVGLLCCMLAAALGCRARSGSDFKACSTADCYRAIATEIEYPQVNQGCVLDADWACVEPLTLTDTAEPEYWDVRLEEVVHMALSQSKVLRDLGGAVLRSPNSLETYWDPALQETDPRFGIEAALSAFDAQFSTSVFGEKNDKALNNEFFGGGTRLLQQDLAVIQTQLSKRAVTGSEFSFRHNIEYDHNNAPANQFPSVWNVNLETEFRHPLLQGSGMKFNRIAGPSSVPGIYNGVLIARVNTDVELADFEFAVRDLVSNVENAYWDLYFAYRDLDAKMKARDAALDTWRRVRALYDAGRRGGEAFKEAQAREQYFRFQEEVENALSGRLIDGTRTYNGSDGGTFRANGGVHVAERRLRMLMGLPPSDGRLMRPADEPISAPVSFDWCEITRESLMRRAELRRQRFETRRRELEWIASKNFLLPRFDLIGRYRWRGFGQDLLDPDGSSTRFDNAYEDLTSGDFQEWQVGLELNVPIGFRRGFAAARNAELQLCRERAILREQEHQVLHNVAAAVADMERAYVVSQTSLNRLDAARVQLEAVRAEFEAEKAPLDLLLDAQRRLADANSRHHRSLAEYAVAVKNVHFAKGTLLDYDGVYLSEGGWPQVAYRDAAEREHLRGKNRPLNYSSAKAPRVSYGPYEQHRNLVAPLELAPIEPAPASEPEPADGIDSEGPTTVKAEPQITETPPSSVDELAVANESSVPESTSKAPSTPMPESSVVGELKPVDETVPNEVAVKNLSENPLPRLRGRGQGEGVPSIWAPEVSAEPITPLASTPWSPKVETQQMAVTPPPNWTPKVQAEPIPTAVPEGEAVDAMRALGISLGGRSSSVSPSAYEEQPPQRLPQSDNASAFER